MSTKVTKKATKDYAKATNKTLLSVSYCNLQHLLKYSNVWGHTERVEGWGADIYNLTDAMIVTGYAPFGDKNISYEVCKKYEAKAIEVINKYIYYSDELVNELENLQNELVNEVLNN